MYDLTSLYPGLEKLERRARAICLGLCAIFLVITAVIALPPIVRGEGLSPVQTFSTLLCLGIAVVTATLAGIMPRFFVGPSSISIDATGIRIGYGPTRTRTKLWEKSAWWFVLTDWREPIAKGLAKNEPSAFSLTRVSSTKVYITEEAAWALLRAAKDAGLKVVKRREGLPRTPIVQIVYVDAKSTFAAFGKWEPA